MNYVSIDTCDSCEKSMVVVKQSIGSNCVLALCSDCAHRGPSIHNQGEFEGRHGVSDSLVVGVRITSTPLG